MVICDTDVPVGFTSSNETLVWLIAVGGNGIYSFGVGLLDYQHRQFTGFTKVLSHFAITNWN